MFVQRLQAGAVDFFTGPIQTCECDVQRAVWPVVEEPPDHLAALATRRERTVQLHTDCSAEGKNYITFIRADMCNGKDLVLYAGLHPRGLRHFA